jgi:hypothetical protein
VRLRVARPAGTDRTRSTDIAVALVEAIGWKPDGSFVLAICNPNSTLAVTFGLERLNSAEPITRTRDALVRSRLVDTSGGDRSAVAGQAVCGEQLPVLSVTGPALSLVAIPSGNASFDPVTAPDRSWDVPTLLGASVMAAYDAPPSARKSANVATTLA